ncbi:MAG: tryptophan--tRNA ligase [bacterium]|nr:tryptophan--tRNA ligase [bacterium]
MTKIEILTGIRPTGDLTIANYLGAIKPIVELQNKGRSPLVFVADLHAITDNEPANAKKFVNEVVADYIAFGINPDKTKIFLQSDIENEVSVLTMFLSRLINVSELLRVPTLKEKLKANVRPETANTFLLLYPVMMTADILLQRAEKIPVGKDQLAHLEVSRELARRFNKKYGKIFPLPQPLQIDALKILSLKGEGKMSKSSPEGAIFLTDDAKTVARKIKGAETAFEGAMNEKLESHILVAKSLCKNDQEKEEIDSLIKEHKKGKPVMGQFKQLFIRITNNFLAEFQAKKSEMSQNNSFISSILEEGAKIARANAQETLQLVKRAMYRQ